jgi:hypothetical protein
MAPAFLQQLIVAIPIDLTEGLDVQAILSHTYGYAYLLIAGVDMIQLQVTLIALF